jgi:hypothetical protein
LEDFLRFCWRGRIRGVVCVRPLYGLDELQQSRTGRILRLRSLYAAQELDEACLALLDAGQGLLYSLDAL